ncbi:uncharacterized protein [Triticum aestivum]|uniref:uncharacterized protein n=1 Tax=Triticum aestivum TaxID=4565 RepID=UPI001D01A48B|nr:uncharacterized protein LOC123168253 [Triticum aestivum]
MASPPRAAAVNQRGAAARTTSCILAANARRSAATQHSGRRAAARFCAAGDAVRRSSATVGAATQQRVHGRGLRRNNSSTAVVLRWNRGRCCDATSASIGATIVGGGAAMERSPVPPLCFDAAHMRRVSRATNGSMQRLRRGGVAAVQRRDAVCRTGGATVQHSGGWAELQCNGVVLRAGAVELQFNIPVSGRSCNATGRDDACRAVELQCTWAPLQHAELVGGGAATQHGRG